MTQAADTTGPSRSRQTLFYQFHCFITSPRIVFVVTSYFKAGTSNVRSQVIQVPDMPAISCPFNRFVPTDWNIEQLPNFLSRSAASDCLAHAPPIGLSGRRRASARSGPGIRAGPTWAGPRRDRPGHGVTVATPGGRDQGT